MHATPATRYDDLAGKAADAVRLLKMLANERRLALFCHLAGTGEMAVGALAEAVGLSQSALSQHLALLRAEGMVAHRREGQTLYYRIADNNTAQVLAILHDIYCAPAKANKRIPR